MLGAGLLKGVYTVFLLTRAHRRNRADPEAVKHIRFTPEDSGWWYAYGWPRRKKHHHGVRPPKRDEEETR